MEQIKTFEDACKAVNFDPAQIDSYPDDVRSFKMASIITKALNGDWKADWENSNQLKYFPYFYMSASGFSSHVFAYWRSYSTAPGRLCFKSSELAEYAGNQFKEIFQDLFMRNEQ